MKKLLTCVLALVMSLTFLTGCGGDPVLDEFENFLNVEMVTPNENYSKLTAEVGTWENYTTNDEFITSIKDNLLPNINDSLEMVKAIELETDEVKAIRDKYVAVLEAYKTGFEGMLTAFENDDTAAYDAAEVKIDEALELLNEYNKALEDLAAEYGMEVTY